MTGPGFESYAKITTPDMKRRYSPDSESGRWQEKP